MAAESLTCLYTNADNLRNKVSELKAILAAHNLDIVAIVETLPKFTTEKVDPLEYTLDGYDKFENINPARGVIVFVRSCMHATAVALSRYHESVFCSFPSVKGEELLFGLAHTV